MRKIITVLLAFALVLGMTMTAFASDNQTEISLTLDEGMETYELVIPATFNLNPDDKGQEVRVPLEVKNINLVWSKELHVYVNSANPDDELGAFLVEKTNPSKKIHYKMYSGMGPDYVGEEMITYRYYYDERSNTFLYTGGGVFIEVDGEYPGSGTYIDTLTFKVVTQ